MVLRGLLYLLIALFPLSELALIRWRRARGSSARLEDRGSVRLLWVVIALSVVAGMVASILGYGSLSIAPGLLYSLTLGFLVAGLALRWAAIVTLGKFFTVDVAIHGDHQVVDFGVYRWIRHPSYTGLLLVFVGLGLFFESWVSLVVMLAPISIALWRRMEVEEAALRGAMGESYVDYCRRTKRLVPGIL